MPAASLVRAGQMAPISHPTGVEEFTTQELGLCFPTAPRTLDEATLRACFGRGQAMKILRLLGGSSSIRKGPLTIALGLMAGLTPAPLWAQSHDAVFRAGAPGSEYRINIGDELEVLVWGEERMQRSVRVQPDGSFAFPLAGTIIAAGLTTQDVSAEIQRQLSDKYKNGPPDVTVTVREAAGMRFFVVGKVREPGSFAASGAVDVLQALSLAGGLAEFADVKGAVILRRTPEGQFIERVQLAQVLKGSRRLDPGALEKPLPVLRSGDVLVIP